MAIIRTIFAPGQTLDLLDPNSWVGGVVPGPNDIAQVGENGDYRTQINMSTPYDIYSPPVKNGGSAILPWTGSDVTIRVDANNTNFNSEYVFPDTDGSFLVYASGLYPRIHIPIKIDYVSKSLDNANFFYSCSVDTSYGSNWTFKTESATYNGTITPLGYYSESYALILDNNFVYPLETEFQLTGSQVWHVGQIETLERCHLTIKDNAHLKLDGSTVNPNAIYNNQDSYRNVIRVIDNATIEVTGSTQRTDNGFFFTNRDEYQRIQISGSDLCPNTTLSSNVNQGDSTITVSNSTGFGEGSIISIDNAQEEVRYFVNTPLSGSNFGLYNGQHSAFYNTTGSYIEQFYGGSTITSSIENHELVKVISQSGNDFTVAKVFGKEGTIHQDLGTYTYEQFVQAFTGSVVTPFSGNKRAVLVHSLHNKFKKGDKLVISRSLVAECLFDDYYLSSSAYYDYNNGATAESSLHMAPYRLTSSIAIPGEIYDDTTLRSSASFDNYFNFNNNLTSSFRTGSNGELTGSLHLNYYGSSNTTVQAHAILTQSYFQEGEITINYNVERNLVNGYDISAKFILDWGCQGYTKHGAVFGQGASSYENGNYFYHNNSYNIYFYNNRSTIIQSKNDKVFGTNTPSHIKLKIVRKKDKEEIYINDNIITTQYNVYSPSPIQLSLYRYVNIFNIDVKNYYQLLLLDTDQPVNKGDNILEGIGLHYDHTIGQRVRTNANQIKDPLGFTDFTKLYWTQKGQTDILPYMHGCTSNRTTGTGNYYNYYLFGTNRAIGGHSILQSHKAQRTSQQAGERKTGAGYYEIWDIQKPISMSAVSIQLYDDPAYDYTEMAGENIQIDVSNDLENWTTVYGPTPDPQYSTMMSQRRFYEFTSGSTSAQFVKLYLNGTSTNTSNALSNIGFHNFYDENNQYLGNTIELYNADMFEVGDQVLFSNLKLYEPRVIWQSNRGGGILDWSQYTLPNVTDLTDDDVVGGMTPLYTITAKNGNRITLDKKICHVFVDKDVFVHKWNQGGVNFVGNSKNLFRFYFYNWTTINNPYQIINTNCNNAGPNTHQNFFSRCQTFNFQFENNSWQFRYGNRQSYLKPEIMKNCIWIGGYYMDKSQLLDTNQQTASRSNLLFNNFAWGQRYGAVMAADQIDFFHDKIISTFNYFYKCTDSGNIYIWNNMSYLDIHRRISKYPKYKLAHNFLSGMGQSDILQYIARNGSWDLKESLDQLEVYDNWYTIGENLYYTNPNAGQSQIQTYQQITNNSKFEPVKSYTDISNTVIDSYRSRVGYPLNSDIQSGTPHPLLFNNQNLLHNDVILINQLAQSFVGIYNPEPNKYHLFQSLIASSYNAGTRSRSGLNAGYKTLFSIDEEQQLQFQLNFDYRTYAYGNLGNTITDNSQLNAGYWDNDWFFPYILLIDRNNKIIDSQILDSTTDVNFNYNKTFTLVPGEYAFGLRIFNWNTLNRYAQEQLVHGPIDFNVYSTKPTKVNAYYNSWDAYKLFETPNLYYSTDNGLRNGAGAKSIMRAANSLPVGTLKIRKLKL